MTLLLVKLKRLVGILEQFAVFRFKVFAYGSFQMGNKTLIYHILNYLTRRIERTCLFAGGCLCFRVICRQKIFKHLAKKLRVERHFLVKRSVFLYREIVSFENVNDTTGTDLFLFLIAVKLREVDVFACLFAKEKEVGEYEIFVHSLAVGETIIILSFILIVETVEQSSVKEWHCLVCKVNKQLRVLEIFLISHQIVDIVVAF